MNFGVQKADTSPFRQKITFGDTKDEFYENEKDKYAKLTDFSKKMQIFGKDGKEIPERHKDFANCLNIKLIKLLGTGSQGEVFSATMNQTQKIAVKRRKVFNNATLESSVFCQLFKEFMISAPFLHPGIVANKFFFWRSSNNDKREKEFYLVSELMEG